MKNLSDKILVNCEAGPWLINEIKQLENKLEQANLEIQRLKNELMYYNTEM